MSGMLFGMLGLFRLGDPEQLSRQRRKGYSEADVHRTGMSIRYFPVGMLLFLSLDFLLLHLYLYYLYAGIPDAFLAEVGVRKPYLTSTWGCSALFDSSKSGGNSSS